jgi:iron complex outermembrane receptor protein
MEFDMKKMIFIPLCSVFLHAQSVELLPLTVYSTKLENSVIDNASTINIIDEEKIQQTQATTIKSLSSLVSNSNISGLGNRNDTTISIRGISNYLAFESSVAIYVDDVPMPFSYAFGLLDMYNIKSLEVLKGANGTLFGKGAESGVINVYTHQPSEAFEGKIMLGMGTNNSKEFYARVSGPTVLEHLNYALSLTKNSTDGTSKNLVTGKHFDTKDFLSFSGKLHYTPTDKLDISLSYTRSESDDGGAPYKMNSKDNPFEIDGDIKDDTLKMQSNMLSLVVKYKEKNSLFTSASSFSKLSYAKNDYVNILGGLDIATDTDIEEFTQEFRYRYSFEHSELMLGAFYSDKTKFDYQENQTLLAFSLSSLNNLSNPDKNMALFTQYRYYFGQNYSIMGGLRYQETKRSFDRTINSFQGLVITEGDSSTWSHILPTLSFSYYGDDNSHSYLTYSKGYRPGGYDYRPTATLLVPFKPETTESYELGYKKTFDKTLMLNTSLFYNNIKDPRITSFTDTLETVSLNGDKAQSYGIEVEFNYKKDDLQLYTSLGYTKSEYTKFTNKEHQQYKNNKLLEIPELTAFVGLRYDISTHLYITGSLHYMGEKFYNIENTAKTDAYSLVNIGAGYTYKDWLIEAYAHNLFDKEYVDMMIYTPSNTAYHFGTPRVVSVRISKSF